MEQQAKVTEKRGLGWLWIPLGLAGLILAFFLYLFGSILFDDLVKSYESDKKLLVTNSNEMKQQLKDHPLTLEDVGIDRLGFMHLVSQMGASYAEVPKPECKNIQQPIKSICSSKEIMDVIWITRRLQIWAEENAIKQELDHQNSHPYCNKNSCLSFRSISENLYEALNESGHLDWMPAQKVYIGN
jgi:hypothetical protein